MICVDDIKFAFRASDEGFVRGLYADWGDFCRHCVDPVIEEVFAPYDRGNLPIVVTSLDLNLGAIPQEDFYRLFPIRLRDELRRKFVFSEYAAVLIRELFAGDMGYGCLIRESDDGNLAEILLVWLETPVTRDDKRRQLRSFAVMHPELLWLLLEKLDRHTTVFRELAALLGPELLFRPGVLLTQRQEEVRRRSKALFPHGETSVSVDKNLLSEVLAASTSYERRRCLSAVLETDPAGVIRMIRYTEDPTTLRLLAGMLDDAMVVRIIAEECRDHAEVDLAAYWKSLCDWLLKLYPEIGAVYFGSEQQFREQLNLALLSVIRRRRGTMMFSKGELTMLFLTEIFGHERYPRILEQLTGRSEDTPGFQGSEQHIVVARLVSEEPFRQRPVTEPGRPEPKMRPPDGVVRHIAATGDGECSATSKAPHLTQERQCWLSEPDAQILTVGNAGLVLLAPWFSRLFAMLGLLREDRKEFIDEESRTRAVFVMQRLVTAEPREYGDQQLAFNRLLAGYRPGMPPLATSVLTEEEIHVTDSMLAGVMANWPQMKHTSQPGFQRCFIERDGYIEGHGQSWHLTVEPRTYDLLLDTLPWGYKVLRLPWLEKTIYINWR